MRHNEINQISKELEEILGKEAVVSETAAAAEESDEKKLQRREEIPDCGKPEDDIQAKAIDKESAGEGRTDAVAGDEIAEIAEDTDSSDSVSALEDDRIDFPEPGLKRWERNAEKAKLRQERKEQRKKRKQEANLWNDDQSVDYSVDGLVLSFLAPVLIMIIIFAQRGIFPFGDNSFLRTDMYHQYAPFFAEFKHKISTDGSLLYSWNIGMGLNFSALYAYYLASPLNWLIALCPKDYVIEFMTYSVVFKIGLSGLSFAYYLKRHCKTESFGIAFFGIFYALSGYMAAYSWNIMWLDCIILFPMIMLGLERLVRKKKGLLYCITLGIAIASNYYISIMICIFMVMYFGALLILEGRKTWKDWAVNVGQFAFYSLMAGALAAVVLLPEIFALQATASGDFSFPKTYTSYFSIIDMFARHIGNVETEIGLDHWPNIYCGVAVLMFFLLYLVCRQVKVREKAVYCGLMLIFMASFSMNIPNFIWHGFHYPNSLPCRQSFIYIALMLVVCFKAYVNLDKTSWKKIAFAFMGALCFVLLAEKMVTQEHFHFIVYYVGILFLALYAGLLHLYKNTKISLYAIAVLTLSVVSIEAAVNTALTSVTTTSRTNYMSDDQAISELMEAVMPGDDFFRVEKIDRKSKNDGAWEHFPSVSLFSSTANADLSRFFKNVGCESSTNAYSITGATPFVDMLFGVKYSIYDYEETGRELLQEITRAGDLYLYENACVQPLGFMLPADIDSSWTYDLPNPADVQNDFAAIIANTQVLEEVEGTTADHVFTFTPEVDGDYYVYVTNKKVESVTAYMPGRAESFENINRGYFLELGYCPADEEVRIETDQDDIQLSAKAYRFSYQGLQTLNDKLSTSGWHLTKWEDTDLRGTIEVAEDGSLFTSIPFDKGWTVWVDGVERTPKKMFDTFMGLDLSAGTHQVVMIYEPEGLSLGAWISGGSALLLILVSIGGYFLEKQKKDKRRRGYARRMELAETEDNSKADNM